ncbi:MAG: PD-(D/E)XK nuclease family protein [Chthonomonadales bacterium]
MATSKTPRKPTLSPTRINAYLDCAMKYRYIYLEKIGRFFFKPRAGLSFGSTLHQVLQTFHEGGAQQDPAELVEQVETRWISAGYNSPEQEHEYREASVGIVQRYHDVAIERIETGVVTLFTEKTISTDMGTFKLSGRVDRIDQHPDGTLEIIDYKSGRMDVTSEEVGASLAMNIYALILARNYPGMRVRTTIHALRSGAEASAEMSSEELADFENHIRTIAEEILSRDFENVEPHRIDYCQYCDFLPKCERWFQQMED